MLLDYILGFGALGLSGIFSKSKHGLVKGYIIGVIGRFYMFILVWLDILCRVYTGFFLIVRYFIQLFTMARILGLKQW